MGQGSQNRGEEKRKETDDRCMANKIEFKELSVLPTERNNIPPYLLAYFVKYVLTIRQDMHFIP